MKFCVLLRHTGRVTRPTSAERSAERRVANEGARAPVRHRPRDATRTRKEILHAAGRRFARVGYSRVTLKEIADDANVTAAMIVRYFGSKLGLFHAVAKDRAGFTPDLPENLSLDALADHMAAQLLEYWQNEDMRWTAMAVIRSLDIEDGAAMLQRELDRRIVSPWRARLTDEDAEVRIRLLTSLTMGVGLFGLDVLLDPDAPGLPAQQSERMAHYLGKMISACLDGAQEAVQ